MLKFEDFLEQMNYISCYEYEIMKEPGIDKEFKEFSHKIKINQSILNIFEDEFNNILNHPYDEEYFKNLKVKTIITKLWRNGKIIKIIY